MSGKIDTIRTHHNTAAGNIEDNRERESKESKMKMEKQEKDKRRKELDGYVGFANLPNQVYRKAVKKGFDFTLMVVGKPINYYKVLSVHLLKCLVNIRKLSLVFICFEWYLLKKTASVYYFLPCLRRVWTWKINIDQFNVPG